MTIGRTTPRPVPHITPSSRDTVKTHIRSRLLASFRGIALALTRPIVTDQADDQQGQKSPTYRPEPRLIAGTSLFAVGIVTT